MKGNIDSENDYNNALKVLDFNEDKIIKFKLPIENSDRSLLRFKKQKSTNKLFPRKYSEIIKVREILVYNQVYRLSSPPDLQHSANSKKRNADASTLRATPDAVGDPTEGVNRR